MNKSILKNHPVFFENILKILDMSLILLSSWLSYISHGDIVVAFEGYFSAILIAVIVALFVFQMTGLYKPWRGNSLINEIGRIIVSWGILFLILALLAVMFKTSEFYSRAWFALWFVFGLTLSIVTHSIIRLVLRKLRQAGVNQRHIVVVSHGEYGLKIIKRLQAEKWNGYLVQGIFANTHLDEPQTAQYLGELEQLASYVENANIDQVWISMPLSEEKQVQQVLESLKHSTVTIRYLPDIFAFNLLNHSFTEVVGLPVIDLSSSPMDGGNEFIKNVEDKVLASLIMLLISPLLLTIALAVKISSKGPVFYRQTRVGWNNQNFTIYKFRSMPVDTETETGPVWAHKSENRATKIGSFLRKTSLDELPQFFNVLKGDMSIVGPRPERPHFVEQFKDEIPGYMKKHMVKAGITGWAQVNGWRGNTDIATRVEFDLYYIENWSLWFDIKIILLTIFKGFIHKNAY